MKIQSKIRRAHTNVASSTLGGKITFILVFIEIVILILYGTTVEFSVSASPTGSGADAALAVYPQFQDIHVMMFIGFGFLMVFLHQHSWSSVGFNFLIAALCIQICILFEGLWHNVFSKHWEKIQLSLAWFILGDFGAATVLISFGAVLGKVNALQLIVMAVIELFFYTLNESIGYTVLKVADIGGSMLIHCFGGVFGLTVSLMVSPKKSAANKRASSNYNSNLISIIGTIFLWMFWPSFNSALTSGSAAHRAIINTILSLTASCLSTFAISIGFNNGKFNMEDILNATLAGGVMLGATADILVNPVYPLLIGFCAGTISTFGFNRVGKFLYNKIGLHDTCGVNNLHAMPGFFGGVIGIIVAAGTTNIDYGYSISNLYSEMSNGRSASDQAAFQCASLMITVGIALTSGFITGCILKMKVFEGPEIEEAFTDVGWWMETELGWGAVRADDLEDSQLDYNHKTNGSQDPQHEMQMMTSPNKETEI